MKKSKQKPNTKRPPEQDDAASELDRALSSFGIDPPKRYRREDVVEEAPQRSRQHREKELPKTRQQRHAEQNKKRKQNKLLRRIVAIISLTLGILAVLVVLSLTVLFKIETVTVEGNQRYAEEEITAVLPITYQDNLFLADTEKAAAKLEQNLPYIYDATISRKLPSTLLVNVTETPTVYAILTEDETYILTDGRFKVLELGVSELPEGAITVTNATVTTAVVGQQIVFGDDKTAENLQLLANAVTDLQLTEITGISSIDINNNYMVYEDRITFKLGTVENLENKIYTALTAAEKLNESNPQVSGTMTITDDKQIYFTEN